MTNRTWIGGGNNEASNAKDWSPTGAPQNGDNLYVPSGSVINIKGLDLSADSLQLGVSSTANISNGSNIASVSTGTFNVKGSNTLGIIVGETPSPDRDVATVNLSPNSTLNFGFMVGNSVIPFSQPAMLFVNSTGKTSLVNNTSDLPSFFQEGVFGPNAKAVINANITGSATVQVQDGGSLELNGVVGSGQWFAVGSGSLQIDQPDKFSGIISGVAGDINLVGLAKADSYTYSNDMISIYGKNGKTIDQLKMVNDSNSPFTVEKTAMGVSIYGPDDTGHPGGTVLPLHS